MTAESRIQDHLTFLYGKETSKAVWPQLRRSLEEFRHRNSRLLERTAIPAESLTERDAFLITYGDQIREPGQPPLQTLAEFLNKYLTKAVSGVHLLPFFPYSSDDGFSVIDYRRIDPELGTWGDIGSIGRNFRLMFDAVINHISSQSAWFRGFLHGQAPYVDYFITEDPSTDLSAVVRPRAAPLLTSFDTVSGPRHVWTTFSSDQIDLNYANPQVLLEIIDLLLFYVEHGAEIIRLDAIAYLWKERGTSCIHLPQTHRVVKLFRAIMESVAPGVLLLTETNVPHEENVSYFGEPRPGTGHYDEAQMVYQFPLAPLLLHAFHMGCARDLTAWASTLKSPAPACTFFNFTASHDGIGLMPLRGLVQEGAVQALIERTLALGGKVSYKTNPDGSQSVYELNITLFDALNDPREPQPDKDTRRFLASQVVMLSLAGVPGIYIHSLFGSRNFHQGVLATGRARSINREKFQRASLEDELAQADSLKHKVFSGYRHLLQQRRKHPAFHPNGEQRVLPLHEALFTLVRTAPAGEETILCLVNVSQNPQSVQILPAEWGLPEKNIWRDLIGALDYPVKGERLSISVEPYQALWLYA
ncbi:MAG: alpha-amylase family glycosyl hydrolase [Candidatus Neomarinimicrobiota bacterium]